MIKIQNFSYAYPDKRGALKNIDLLISSGEFVLVAGPNGGGKSTLLQSILGVIPEYYDGDVKGDITFDGQSVKSIGIVGLAGKVGIVLQDPESQISNLTAWEEVTFALGNLLLPKSDIIQRGTDALKTMKITTIRDAFVDTLSGGQLQRLAIATLLAIKPKVLILDEPLANLDPLGVGSVVEAIRILKEHIDIVIVASHWLDPFLDMSTRLLTVNEGSIVLDIPTEFLDSHLKDLETYSVEIPQKFLIKQVLSAQGITTTKLSAGKTFRQQVSVPNHTGPNTVTMENVDYAYMDYPNTLKNISLDIKSGSMSAIVGRNGAGKSTLAKLLAGLRKATRGRLLASHRTVSMTMQKPSLSFLTGTLMEELRYGVNMSEQNAINILANFNLEHLKNVSPFSLSGGEQRRFSLALALSVKPDFIILDEPTAGADAQQVRFLQKLMTQFSETSVFITHDPRLIGPFLTKVIVLENGFLAFEGDVVNMPAEMFNMLGYHYTNATVALAAKYLKVGIPTHPSQLEVIDEISI